MRDLRCPAQTRSSRSVTMAPTVGSLDCPCHARTPSRCPTTSFDFWSGVGRSGRSLVTRMKTLGMEPRKVRAKLRFQPLSTSGRSSANHSTPGARYRRPPKADSSRNSCSRSLSHSASVRMSPCCSSRIRRGSRCGFHVPSHSRAGFTSWRFRRRFAMFKCLGRMSAACRA